MDRGFKDQDREDVGKTERHRLVKKFGFSMACAICGKKPAGSCISPDAESLREAGFEAPGIIIPICRRHIQQAMNEMPFLLANLKYRGAEVKPDEKTSRKP